MLIEPGTKVSLKDIDPADCGRFESKQEAKGPLREHLRELARLQHLLYAEARHGLLVVLQGTDTSGKDGVCRKVITAMDPLGVHVKNFRAPSEEERAHDYLWRIHKAVPGRGEVVVFNRSHYEDVVTVRVHELVPPEVWRARFEEINRFEKYLTDNGIVLVKFFLHISKGEQKERLEARLKDPTKYWKFNPRDVKERRRWGEYREAYEEALAACSTPWAPWHVVPADRKWYRNYVVAETLVQTLQGLKMQFPEPDFDPSAISID